MRLIEAIEADGLTEEFKTRARPHVLNEDLLAWLKTVFAGRDVIFPSHFRRVRSHFGCPATRGGIRPRGEKFHQVSRRKGFNRV